MTMPKKPKYPKHIYLNVEKNTDGTTTLLAEEDAAGHAEINGEVEVALYDYVGTFKVRADAKVE
jgi:hypothetical protein